jgi:hypothetical protein
MALDLSVALGLVAAAVANRGDRWGKLWFGSWVIKFVTAEQPLKREIKFF